MDGNTLQSLLERAAIKVEDYNWVEAGKLYEQATKLYLDEKLIEEAAVIYKKLGFVYSRAIETADTAEDFLEHSNRAVKAYKEAANLFKQIENLPENLECEAEVFYVKGFIAGSVLEGKNAYNKSFKLFIKSSEYYSEDDNQENLARILSRAAMVCSQKSLYLDDRRELEEFHQKSRDILKKALKFSKNVENVQFLSESIFSEGMLNSTPILITLFQKDEQYKKYLEKLFLRIDESLRLTEASKDPRSLGWIYFTHGNLSCIYANFFIEEEREQRKAFDKGLKLLEQALDFSRKAKMKIQIVLSLFWINWWAFWARRFNYVQKRIFKDVQEILKLREIYANSNLWVSFFANFLPMFYYANIANLSMFTLAQRKTYAKKGIEYGKETLKALSSVPFSALSYQMLTYSLSHLATLTTVKNERDELVQKMLHYAKQSNKIGENFEGGMARAAGYSSLYRAYKTLGDIAENKEEKIKMFSAAADASRNYMKYTMESLTGNLATEMRLGLLYEEIGIITGKPEPLIQAKESLFNVVKEVIERGYYYYAAVANEYIARIEDRLGNHSASAEYYEKALDFHRESLKTVKYKPRINRINEKINYARAWSLIEKAKTYHKRENHIRSKEKYEKAYEILKELSSYNYEAEYYSAWILLEEAEQLSKQEKHEEAIKRYESTIKTFNNTTETLEKTFKDSKNKIERERIKKLKKLAKVRINHCSARASVEKARILGMQGEHLEAAEEFAFAASKFNEVCNQFKIEKERKELEAGYYLCRAWESMELAENYGDSNRFAEAVGLFTKASKLFASSKMKSLALGNSAFCQALESGCKFDEATEKNIKAELYPKIKVMLRKAADSYRKGGFENGADWALATSTYFDAAWHLIRADEEMRLDEKKKLLEIGAKILKSASEFFSKAGYKDKEREILERLDMVKKEEKVLISALNTIKEPTLSRSTVGIAAPACPIETSQSPRLGEIRQFTEESIRVSVEEAVKKKYKLIYRDLLKEYPRIQRRECRVGVAQIGLSNTGDILSEFYEEKASGLLSFREDKVEIARSKVKNMIEIANSEGVNILLFPEMTVDLNYGELLEDISNLAKTYEMYIIPGSYHDQEIKRNLSVVIGPDGILWEQEKHIPAIIHLEGKRFKEGIDVGDIPRKTIICNTEYGRIAIIICRDFLDMDLRVELKNFEPPVDIILNPAFTPVTADFKAAHFDARRSIYAYCFFANVAEFGDSLIYTPEKERIERTIQPKKEDLIYKDIDLFKLRSERKKWEKEQSKERRFIQSTRE